MPPKFAGGTLFSASQLVLCFNLNEAMHNDGTYSKRRRRITEPVVQMPQHLSGKREPDVPVPRPREVSAGVVFASRAAGWVVAVLLFGLLFGVVYVGTSLFTRELQFEHLRDEMRQLNGQVDQVRAKQLTIERRLVQLETELENHRETVP